MNDSLLGCDWWSDHRIIFVFRLMKYFVVVLEFPTTFCSRYALCCRKFQKLKAKCFQTCDDVKKSAILPDFLWRVC